MTNIGRMYGITQEPPAPKEDRKAKATKAVDRVTEKYAPTVVPKPSRGVAARINSPAPPAHSELVRARKAGRPAKMSKEEAKAKRAEAERERHRTRRAAQKANAHG